MTQIAPETLTDDGTTYRLANLCTTSQQLQTAKQQVADYGLTPRIETHHDTPLDSFHTDETGGGTVYAVYYAEPTARRSVF